MVVRRHLVARRRALDLLAGYRVRAEAEGPFPDLVEVASLDRRVRAALRPGAGFTVHSVFERTLNLVDGDGSIFGLVGPRGGNGPATAVLRSLPADFPPAWLQVGVAARVEQDRRLVIGGRLVLDAARAEVWHAPQAVQPILPGQVWDNVRRAASLADVETGPVGLRDLLFYLEFLLLGSANARPGFFSTLLAFTWDALEELLPAWVSADTDAVGRAAGRLVGLGPGQTPSGDDLLAGFMVADERVQKLGVTHVAHSPDAQACLRAAVLEAAQGRTTDLGLARLRYAAEGDLDERSELVLAKLLGPSQWELQAATRRLAAFGHSSGLDTLVGLLLGLGLALRPWHPAYKAR